MDAEPSAAVKFVARAVVVLVVAGGFALLAYAAVSGGEAPVWMWIAGALMIVITLPVLVGAVRLRMLPEEERERRLTELRNEKASLQRRVDKSDLAYAATKYKDAVMRDGIPGTALITAVEFGGRGNDFGSLVYLELAVTTDDGVQSEVPTGEWLDAASTGSVAPGRELVVRVDPVDISRVAVDWEASLRLR